LGFPNPGGHEKSGGGGLMEIELKIENLGAAREVLAQLSGWRVWL
jgi:hypothetical protein